MLFENIEEESKKDQKLSSLEKSIILGLVLITKVILWKVKQAKTYGDLMKLGNFLENKIDSLEIKYPNKSVKTEDEVGTALYEIKETETELKNL